MAVTVAAVMRQIHHFFERERIDGTFVIAGGALTPLPDAPFVAVSGSSRHDGIFPRGELPDDPQDETFDGTVWGLHPPADFLALCQEISDYDDKNPVGAMRSESFGAYGYARGDGAGSGWEAAFDQRLAPYRRMFTEVNAG